MTNIKCNVKTCKYYNNDKCMSSEIDVGKRDAVKKEQTICETYRKKGKGSFLTEFGLLNAYSNHDICCEAKNCKYNDKCICKKDSIQINEKHKECESFKLEKY